MVGNLIFNSNTNVYSVYLLKDYYLENICMTFLLSVRLSFECLNFGRFFFCVLAIFNFSATHSLTHWLLFNSG